MLALLGKLIFLVCFQHAESLEGAPLEAIFPQHTKSKLIPAINEIKAFIGRLNLCCNSANGADDATGEQSIAMFEDKWVDSVAHQTLLGFRKHELHLIVEFSAPQQAILGTDDTCREIGFLAAAELFSNHHMQPRLSLSAVIRSLITNACSTVIRGGT